MKYFLNRLREPSTWAAISALGVVFGLPPGTIDLAAQVAVGITGLAGIVLKDKGDAPK
ncbi:MULTISPECIES: hypothetical protein [unclassified Acidovorax]|uniref:hypothetical protein n=1 Tax=unclassified Acidovorax TaxID=2684926 RepID=UPI00234B80F5|nr:MULTISPECIES: hypothetical protein [unclassified Acidovorax]WCM95713.1 hypothetical protein M5C96_14615 [Acidovorax sp. GBBC 1281]GKS96781.1 hypothetical protein AVAK2825_19620 [Acidovorax sp. SUPP2825]GKT19568.1 hypothetical protein AVHY2522_22960 [Acidovorax sp. SUPP2522]